MPYTIADNALRRMNVKIDKLDLKDWEVIEYDIKPIEQPRSD